MPCVCVCVNDIGGFLLVQVLQCHVQQPLSQHIPPLPPGLDIEKKKEDLSRGLVQYTAST